MNLSKQRGVALITVLLVFALVAVIATEIIQRSQLNVRSVSGLVDTRQAYYYALAGEAYARQVLAQDLIQRNSPADTLIEPWAKTAEAQPFDIDGGTMRVEIHDLQARLNLNNVVDENGVARPEGLDQFKRLLSALQLNANYANEWVDWLDADQVPAASGAEDPDYADYMTAGASEADISALRLLRSMQPEDYAKLAPHVTVLPAQAGAGGAAAGPTPVNINTADSAVLQALSPILSETRAAQIISRQQSGGYRDVNDFLQVVQLSDPSMADVKSSYFEILVTVNYANRWQRVRTVLQRINKSGTVSFQILSRVRSPLIDDIE